MVSGKGAREVDRVRQLRMILPGLEAQPELRELGEALAEFGIAHQVRRHDAGGEFADRLAAVPRHAVADAAEAPAADRDLGLQHVAHARAEREVGVADDRLGDAARAVTARRAHRGDAVDELDLAHRRHLGGAVPCGTSTWHSRKTVATMLCPPPMSASSSGRK